MRARELLRNGRSEKLTGRVHPAYRNLIVGSPQQETIKYVCSQTLFPLEAPIFGAFAFELGCSTRRLVLDLSLYVDRTRRARSGGSGLRHVRGCVPRVTGRAIWGVAKNQVELSLKVAHHRPGVALTQLNATFFNRST